MPYGECHICVVFQWSFGVTVWELLTFGLEPYYDVDAADMYLYLRHGHRLTQPYGCHQELCASHMFIPFNSIHAVECCHSNVYSEIQMWFQFHSSQCLFDALTLLAGATGTAFAVTLNNKKAVLPQGNRAMPQVFFSVEVRQQHSLQV